MYAILNNEFEYVNFTNNDDYVENHKVEHDEQIYIKLTEEEYSTLIFGDKYNFETKEWELIDRPIPPKPEVEPYTPTNTEIAQMISDLQADLIIAGVI